MSDNSTAHEDSDENGNSQKIPFHPRSDQYCSDAFYGYLKDYRDQLNLFFFTIDLVGRADDMAQRAADALLPGAKDDNERQELNRIIENKGSILKRYTKFSYTNATNILTVLVNGYLTYICNILKEVILCQPSVLKSSEMIKIEDALSFNNRAELVSYLTDKTISSLSYAGIAEMNKYIQSRLGINLFIDDSEREKIAFSIEARNVTTHNRGYVDRIFLERLSGLERRYKVGDRVHMDYDKLIDLTHVCVKAALAFDERVAQKFDIKRQSVRDHIG